MSDTKATTGGTLFTPFNMVAGLILLVGGVITVLRFTGGLGAVTNLSDYNPWGLWIGFDLLVGVALAAGGVCNLGRLLYLWSETVSFGRAARHSDRLSGLCPGGLCPAL